MVETLMVAGALLAGASGFCGGLVVLRSRCRSRRRGVIKHLLGADDLVAGLQVRLEVTGLDAKVIGLLLSRSERARIEGKPAGKPWTVGFDGMSELLGKSGLAGLVTQDGFGWTRMTLSLSGLCAGALMGSVFSNELAGLSCLAGFALGWRMPKAALEHERDARTEAVERDLSQMIEVVVLGLRSGLSFDRALGYYHQCFSGSLARGSALAQTQWSYGLVTRGEGLRHLAAAYDSLALERTVEAIDRSLLYGTSLVGDLSEQAVAARTMRRTKLEERVAKAPVKMMLPVGTLILPAMLMLVVGPILLELMGGF